MVKSGKIAISLPQKVLAAVEKERKHAGETRSAFFLRAVEKLLREKQRERDVRQYIRGYKRMPETDEEVATFIKAGAEVWAENPWK